MSEEKKHQGVVSGNPNSPFKVTYLSDVGAGEAFVSRLSLGLTEVFDAMFVQSHEDTLTAQQIKHELNDLVMECLIPAFLSLRELRQSVGNEEIPVLTKLKHFNDMYRTLWSAYKDRMQTIAKMLGFNIGFLFENDQKFEKGCAQFLTDNPRIHPELHDMLKWDRDSWQNRMSKLRNDVLEHKTLKLEDFPEFYTLNSAEIAFDNVWMAIEDILASLAASKFSEQFCLTEIPNTRNHTALKRFGFGFAEGVSTQEKLKPTNDLP
jgi:hypothetical protein